MKRDLFSSCNGGYIYFSNIAVASILHLVGRKLSSEKCTVLYVSVVDDGCFDETAAIRIRNLPLRVHACSDVMDLCLSTWGGLMHRV